MTQALNSPRYTKKALITNKVTTDFFATLIKSISYAPHTRPTAFSRLMRSLKISTILMCFMFVLLASGCNAKDNMVWVESWTEAAPLNTRRTAAATVANGQFIYVAGGGMDATEEGILKTVEYTKVKPDGTLEPWRYTKELNVPRSFSVGVAYNGYFYVMGGENLREDDSILNSVERAAILPDGSLGDWTLEPTAMNVPRRAPATFIIGNRMYVSGGFYGIFLSDVESAEILQDGSLGPWRKEPSDTGFERYIHTSIVLRQRVYLFGGHSTKPGGAMVEVEWAKVNSESGYIDPWEIGPPMLTQRYLNGAALHNDTVYLVGGRSSVVLTSVEKLNIPAGSENQLRTLNWEADTPLNEPREGVSVVIVGDNIYAIGGRSHKGIIASVERSIIRPNNKLGYWATEEESKEKIRPKIPMDAISHFTLGDEHQKSGNLSYALREFKEGVRLAPNVAEGYNLIGELYLKLKEYLSAKKAFNKALQIKPGYNLARFNLGITHYQLKEYDAAIKEYKQVLEKLPDSLPVRQNLAITYFDTGKYEKAIVNFEYLVKKYPDNLMIKGFLKASRDMEVKKEGL